jgi:type I restriction enzyme R subunit
MERNIAEAVKLYSGDKPLGMFAVKLDKNLENMNAAFTQIKNLFIQAGVPDFERLPCDIAERKQFAKLFKEFNEYLESAKVQGFVWNKLLYSFSDEKAGENRVVELILDEKTYLILTLRYKELFSEAGDGDSDDSPYDLTGYLTTIDTDEIDADYMNSRFEKYKKALFSENPAEAENAKAELHKTFASLTQEEQKYANIFLHDIESGDAAIEEGKTLRDYINEYVEKAKNDQIHRVASLLGLDEEMLRSMMALKIDESNINEYGRLDNLKATVDKARAKAYFEAIENTKVAPPKVNIKVDKLLRDFIVSGGYEIPLP